MNDENKPENVKDKPRKVKSAKLENRRRWWAEQQEATNAADAEKYRLMQSEQIIKEVGSSEEYRIEKGAAALMKAFPTMREDFTDEWFRKAAKIVIDATGGH